MLITAVRGMVGLTIAAMLAMSGLVLATAAPAFACSCAMLPDLEEKSARADAVFVAEVKRMTKVKQEFEYAVKATRSFKGTIEGRTTITNKDGCGLTELKIGKEYVFLVNGDTAPYTVRRCSGSAPADDERIVEVEAVLDPAPAIEEPDPPAPTMTKVEQSVPASVGRLAAPGAAMVLIGFLGLFVVRRLSQT